MCSNKLCSSVFVSLHNCLIMWLHKETPHVSFSLFSTGKQGSRGHPLPLPQLWYLCGQLSPGRAHWRVWAPQSGLQGHLQSPPVSPVWPDALSTHYHEARVRQHWNSLRAVVTFIKPVHETHVILQIEVLENESLMKLHLMSWTPQILRCLLCSALPHQHHLLDRWPKLQD